MPARFSSAFSLLLLAAPAAAGDTLLYLEGQGVAGYSSAAAAPVYHSMSAADAMQKSSAGFDLVHKFYGEAGDAGTLAVQARLAWDKDAPNRLEPQLYNAYYRLRTPYGYAWAGHNRAAAGLESYTDTHGALLQTLPMYGYGLDRDWGAGWSRDFDGGNAAASLTTGSGMRLRGAGGWLAGARAAAGVLNSDNYTAGLYLSAGEVPWTAGYTLVDGALRRYSAAGADLTLLWDAWELRADLRGGRMRGMAYIAGLGRLGFNVLPEGGLKLEAQAVYSGMERMEGWIVSAGASYALTPYLTLRAACERDVPMNDRRVTGQVYYYLPI